MSEYPRRAALLLSATLTAGTLLVPRPIATAEPAATPTTAQQAKRHLCRLKARRPTVVYVSGIPRYVQAHARVKCRKRKQIHILMYLRNPHSERLFDLVEKTRRGRHLRGTTKWGRDRGCRLFYSIVLADARDRGEDTVDWSGEDITRPVRLCL